MFSLAHDLSIRTITAFFHVLGNVQVLMERLIRCVKGLTSALWYLLTKQLFMLYMSFDLEFDNFVMVFATVDSSISVIWKKSSATVWTMLKGSTDSKSLVISFTDCTK